MLSPIYEPQSRANYARLCATRSLWDLVLAILVLAAVDVILSWYKAPAGVRLVALLGIILMSLVNNFAGATFRKALTVPCCTASHFAGAFLR